MNFGTGSLAARSVTSAKSPLPMAIAAEALRKPRPLRLAYRQVPLLGASLRQRTAAFFRAEERLVAGHHGELLVVVPRLLRFRGLLHLEQIHVVDHTAILLHLALRKGVVDRQFLQLLGHGFRILGAGRLDRLQIAQRCRIGAGMDHARHPPRALEEALREGGLWSSWSQ